MHKTIVTIPATVEPVTLAEAKAQLRLEDSFTLDDAFINDLISAARDRVESYCNRFFTEQSILISWDEPFPVGEIDLPYPDLAAVTSVQYVADNTLNTVDPADYYVDLVRQKITGTFPTADNYRVSATTSAPTELSGVKQAILMIVTDLYELRTESVVASSVTNNPAVKAQLYPYRVNLGI
mgnify:CR=1 FL=1